MSDLVIFFLFLSGLSAALLVGPAAAFAGVYVPTLLLVNLMPPLELPRMPDLSPSFAVVAGIGLALLFTPAAERRIRWNLLDTVVVLLGASAIITGITTEFLYTGVNIFFEQFLGFVLPYLLARIAFGTPHGRSWMLASAAFSAVVIAMFAVIEMRLYPHFYRSIFETVGLYPSGRPRMAYRRWFLFRAESTFEHPIYLGNACLALMGMVLVLGLSTVRGLKQPTAWIGAAAAFAGMVASISFSPYNGFVVGCFVFIALQGSYTLRSSLPVVPLTILLAGIAITTWIAIRPLPPKPPPGSNLSSSAWIRKLIIKNTADMVVSAGPFGHGKRIPRADIDLASVDNTYVLYGMSRGWVYLGLWMAIPVALSFQVRRAYAACWTPSHRLMLSVGYATVLASMVAMYTVWAGWGGFPYTLTWLILVACVSTASMMLIEANPQPSAVYEPAGDYAIGEAA